MNNYFLFLLSAAVNQSTGAGFADGVARLNLQFAGDFLDVRFVHCKTGA
jgi:hypothetical protein